MKTIAAHNLRSFSVTAVQAVQAVRDLEPLCKVSKDSKIASSTGGQKGDENSI